MDKGFKETIFALTEKYARGQDIYKVLMENRTENTDILICPAHIGDTLWIAIYAEAYKAKHGCNKLLFVVPENQVELMSIFPQIDDAFGISGEEFLCLKTYIGYNKLWFDNHIRYAHFPFTMTLNCDGIFWENMTIAKSDQSFMINSRMVILDLENNSKQNRAIAPNPKEEDKKYSNAVLLLPAARTQPGTIEESFWTKVTEKLKERGYDVYCNFNNLPYEMMVDGATPLSTSLVEIYNMSHVFKRFIGFRSGALDLLAVGDAPITSLHCKNHEVSEMVLTKDSVISEIMNQFEDLSALQSYQYRPEWEDELVEMVVNNI